MFASESLFGQHLRMRPSVHLSIHFLLQAPEVKSQSLGVSNQASGGLESNHRGLNPDYSAFRPGLKSPKLRHPYLGLTGQASGTVCSWSLERFTGSKCRQADNYHLMYPAVQLLHTSKNHQNEQKLGKNTNNHGFEYLHPVSPSLKLSTNGAGQYYSVNRS